MTLHPDLPPDAAHRVPEPAPPAGPFPVPVNVYRLLYVHSALALACLAGATLVLLVPDTAVGVAVCFGIGLAVYVHVLYFMVITDKYDHLIEVAFRVSSPALALLIIALAAALAFAQEHAAPGLPEGLSTALLPLSASVVLMAVALRRDPPGSFPQWPRERRERPAATTESEFVHLVDYVMPRDVFASPMEYLVPGPRSRALESVQEAADHVTRAAHVLGSAAVTADVVALARRAEWRTVVAMVNQRRPGARADTAADPPAGTPDTPARAHERDTAALVELGACADRALRAHRRLEELGGVPDTGPVAVLRSVLGRRRAVQAARLQREQRVHALLRQAAALRRSEREHGGTALPTVRPLPPTHRWRSRPRTRTRSRLLTALAGAPFAVGAALAMDRPELDGLLLIGMGWACLSALVVWANLRLAAPSPGFLLFAVVLMLFAGARIMPLAADGVEYLLERLAPRVLAAVGGSATPLFLMATALACWTIAAVGIGRIRGRQE